MTLPSGYTKLEYIESTGTQYIDTGFVPSSTVSIVIDFNSSVSSGVIIGQDSGYKVKGFMLAMTVVVFGSTKKDLSISANARHVVQLDQKNFKIDNGTSSVINTSTFNGAYPLFLFGNNRSGSFSEGVAMRLYSCQIYDGNAVEFDFTPCKTTSGVVGLWDNVSNKFYSNAGTGSFKAGPSSVDLTAHKTLVNGTAYTVQGGKCMVDGTVYNILKGRTLIDGTGWDITLPSAGTALSALDVGQSVFTNVGGQKTEFLVVHQGLPSSLYDSSCDGTWLLIKDCYEERQWHSSSTHKYETSDVNTYLNGPFFKLFDSNIQGIIKQVKIPYRKGGGSGGTDQSGANGLSCKVFLLSGPEVGLAGARYMPNDGAKLDYFNANTGKDPKRIAYLKSSSVYWWLRSPNANYSEIYVWVVTTEGGYGDYGISHLLGIRPCIILPSDTLVNNEFELIA